MFRLRVEALSDSWASQSSKLMYDVQRSVVPGTSSRAEYIDTYSRGIKFTFVTRGLIYKFDFQTALDGFIQALLLGLAAFSFSPCRRGLPHLTSDNGRAAYV